MKTRSEILVIVRKNVKVIRRKLRDCDFDETTHLVQDLNFDKIDRLDFIENCEKELKIEIPDFSIVEHCNIGEFADYLETLQTA